MQLSFKQLIDLVRQFPYKEKLKLNEIKKKRQAAFPEYS